MIRRAKKAFFCTGFFLLTAVGLFAQKIDAALEKLIKQYPEEKVHLHLDKDFYLAGETIWFKAYLYSNNLPSLRSTNFYIQLLDINGQVVKEGHYPVVDAAVSGSILIPDSLPKGNYWLRAFTPWMQNFGEEFLYHRALYIINTNNTGTSPVSSNAPQTISIRFFPESGHLTSGILGTVAFEATYSNGLPAEVEGSIKAEDGTVITSFKTYYNGMGKVQFKPIEGNKYTGEIIVSGKPVNYPLPEMTPGGINLKVLDEKGGKMFQLARNAKSKEEFNKVHLVVVQNKLIIFETDVTFDDYPSVRGHILTDNLPTGILQFIVFDQNDVPLAERLAFVNNGEYKSNVSLNIVSLKKGKREKNSFEILFGDSTQRSLSVSVSDAAFKLPDQETIFSRFLLSSDLQGQILNPDWYFTNSSDTAKQALDLVMLTHGWRKYHWEKILNNEYPLLNHQDPGMLKISGTVMDAKDKNLVQGGGLSLTVESPGMPQSSYEVIVDTKGRFELDSLFLFGNTKAAYNYINVKGKPQQVIVTPDEEEKTVNKKFSDQAILNKDVTLVTNAGAIKNTEKIAGEFKVLEEVQAQVVAKRKDSLSTNEKYATGPFTKEARITFDFIKTPPKNQLNQGVVDFVRQNVQQIQYNGSGFVSRKNFSLGGGGAWPVTIFLDNTSTSIGNLQGLFMSEVAMIKFYETGFFGTGTTSSGGTIAVFMKRGDDLGQKESQPANLPFFTVNGYSVSKEFYRPDYSVPNLAPVTSDRSSTLYWNPAVRPSGNDQKINIDYYTNDLPGKIRIVAEGFDAAGKLIHLEKIIDN